MLKRLTLSTDASGENGDGADVSSEQSEDRLRRSLEMLSGGARREPSEHVSKPSSYSPASARRHRFKDDGEVPVVHVAPHRDRGAGGSTLMTARSSQFNDSHAAEDRAARERAEKALEAARESVHHLQTRLGHAELALRESVGQAEARDQALAAAQRAASEHQAQLSALRLSARQADAARDAAEASFLHQIEKYRERIEELEAECDTLRRERTRLSAQIASAVVQPPPLPRQTRQRRVAPVELPNVEELEPVKWWLASEKKAATATRRAKG